MSDRTFLILDTSLVWEASSADGSINLDAALARLRGLTLQPADWLRLLTCARVIAITSGMEHDAPVSCAGMTSLLDKDFFDELSEGVLDANRALPRLRTLHLTASGWRRVLMIARVMAAVGSWEGASQ